MPTPTKRPVRKVAAGGLAGAIVTIIMFLLTVLAPEAEIPQGLEAALTTVVTFLVSYLTPPGSDEAVVVEAGEAKSAIR